MGARLAYRDLDSVTRLAGRKIADSGTLGTLLHRGVYQEPAPATAGGVIAVSATTVTPGREGRRRSRRSSSSTPPGA